jgi:hypothetical protein
VMQSGVQGERLIDFRLVAGNGGGSMRQYPPVKHSTETVSV